MGKVKNYYWDEINARANEGPEPPDAEQFYADMELEKAKELVRAASATPRLKEEKHEPR